MPKEYSMTQKGLDAVYEIIKSSPPYLALIDEFLEDLHKRDNIRDCKYRCGGKPGEPCKNCVNYKFCDDNNYQIIEKWEGILNNEKMEMDKKISKKYS